MIQPMSLDYLEVPCEPVQLPQQDSKVSQSVNKFSNLCPIENLYYQLLSMQAPNLKCNVLANHEIRPETRAKMISWMIEVLSQFRCEGQTFFLSVSYLDRFLAASRDVLKDCEIHLIGIVCMFIASKMQETPCLSLQIVHDKIALKKFTTKQILQAELKVLETLDYDLGVPTAIEFLGVLTQVNPLPLVVNRTAEIILILWQHYDSHPFSPSEQATAALVIACTCLNQIWLVPKIFQFSGYNEQMLRQVMDEMYKGTINFGAYFPRLRSCMMYLKFEIVRVRPGPLFIFLEQELVDEQSRLLAIINN
jgi:hypothetical protein